jgi:hypothetical protein
MAGGVTATSNARGGEKPDATTSPWDEDLFVLCVSALNVVVDGQPLG